MEMKYCFGIDVGGTTVKCGLFTVEGELLEEWEIPTRTENAGEAILPDIAKSILEKIESRKMAKEQVTGIGIGVPGPVNRDGEIPMAVNLGWGYKHIPREMTELTGLPAKAGNDANVAALGEAWKGAAEGCANVILATLGTGVGGGIIVDGRIVSGAHGAGGEIGHANVRRGETDRCNCGNSGCLEQMASATGIVRLARKALESSSLESPLRKADLTAKDVFDAYKDGDALAGEIVGQFADYLGGALANFAVVVDPDVILLGGGVSKAGAPLVDAVAACYRKYAFTPCRETPIRLAMLGNRAGIYGAARLVQMNQRENEYVSHFKSLIDQDRCAVVICNLQHEIIYMNPAAVESYKKSGGEKLVGTSIFDCHNERSGEKIREVVRWFARSPENNLVYTFHNEKQNKDVYMVALRDEGELIGYYEKHEYRNRETMKLYDID